MLQDVDHAVFEWLYSFCVQCCTPMASRDIGKRVVGNDFATTLRSRQVG